MRDLFFRIKEHDRWRGEECINLIPSENHTSPRVQEILASDMSRRYTLPFNQMVHGSLVENAYRGTKYLDEVEDLGEKVACKVFNAKYASLKPLSGHVSALIALISTCERGDRILTINAKHGGYDGYMQDYMPSFLGLKVGYLPFDGKTWNLNAEGSVEMIIGKRPKVVVIGSSFILFPFELRKLKRACKEVGALLLYDASHVLGLMPWNFQNPLREGVDILYGSTHKTFFGPQGGLILTRQKKLFDMVSKKMIWTILDNAHWNRIAALGQALMEYDRFGKDYGAQVVKNSKVMGEELNDMGISVRFGKMGYTECHMILLDEKGMRAKQKMSFNDWAVKLERSNIIADAVGRIGVNEVTRLGAKEEHIKTLAGLIKTATKRNVKREVLRLRKGLGLDFCP